MEVPIEYEYSFGLSVINNLFSLTFLMILIVITPGRTMFSPGVVYELLRTPENRLLITLRRL